MIYPQVQKKLCSHCGTNSIHINPSKHTLITSACIVSSVAKISNLKLRLRCVQHAFLFVFTFFLQTISSSWACPVLLHSSAHPRVIAPKSVPKMSYLLQKIISWAIRPWDFAPPCLIGVPIQKQWLLPLLFHDSWNLRRSPRKLSPRRSPRKLSRHLDRVKLPNQNNKAISSSNSNVQGETFNLTKTSGTNYKLFARNVTWSSLPSRKLEFLRFSSPRWVVNSSSISEAYPGWASLLRTDSSSHCVRRDMLTIKRWSSLVA